MTVSRRFYGSDKNLYKIKVLEARLYNQIDIFYFSYQLVILLLFGGLVFETNQKTYVFGQFF